MPDVGEDCGEVGFYCGKEVIDLFRKFDRFREVGCYNDVFRYKTNQAFWILSES